MAQTFKLTREQALELLAFCQKHKQQEFYVAKDNGAYVGATKTVKGKLEKRVFYMPGCDPVKNANWYDTARSQYGGDDFGEQLPIAMLEKVKSRDDITGMAIKLTATRVTCDYTLARKVV